MDAEYAEFAHGKAQAEGGEYGYGKHKNYTLKQSGHRHHQGGPQGEAGRIPVRRMIAQEVRRR
jgi:hypothetical protein